MAKSPDAFRTISEVAEWLDVPAHVLRFWESRFAQVKPVKRAGGRRYYRPTDMELLGGIKRLLHEDGMTIRGVQKILREDGARHVADLSRPLRPEAGAEEFCLLEAEPHGAVASSGEDATSSQATEPMPAVASEGEMGPARPAERDRSGWDGRRSDGEDASTHGLAGEQVTEADARRNVFGAEPDKGPAPSEPTACTPREDESGKAHEPVEHAETDDLFAATDMPAVSQDAEPATSAVLDSGNAGDLTEIPTPHDGHEPLDDTRQVPKAPALAPLLGRMRTGGKPVRARVALERALALRETIDARE